MPMASGMALNQLPSHNESNLDAMIPRQMPNEMLEKLKAQSPAIGCKVKSVSQQSFQGSISVCLVNGKNFVDSVSKQVWKSIQSLVETASELDEVPMSVWRGMLLSEADFDSVTYTVFCGGGVAEVAAVKCHYKSLVNHQRSSSLLHM